MGILDTQMSFNPVAFGIAKYLFIVISLISSEIMPPPISTFSILIKR